jgi:hypothetical protein
MSILVTRPLAAGRSWSAVRRGLTLIRLLPALALLLGGTLLLALEAPSKPFLDKNSFFLTSAGFRVQLANDPAGKKALRALPPHRFVTHRIGNGNDVRYFYAEPQHCSCIFIGTQAAYESYLDMLRQPLRQADDISPDYRSQASALLNGTAVWMDTLELQDRQTLTEYFKLSY